MHSQLYTDIIILNCSNISLGIARKAFQSLRKYIPIMNESKSIMFQNKIDFFSEIWNIIQ